MAQLSFMFPMLELAPYSSTTCLLLKCSEWFSPQPQYLTYLSSPKLFSIRTELIYQGQANGCVVEAGVNPPGTKIVMLGTDNGAAIFFRYKGESDIFIWNSETTFKPENFLLVQKGGDCRLSTQVVPGYKRLMWALESNFYDYIANTVGCLGASMYVQPLIKTCE